MARLANGARSVSLARLERRALFPFTIVSGVFFAVSMYVNLRGPAFGFDFRGVVWDPAGAVAHSRSPYPHMSAGRFQLEGNSYGYPPLLALLAMPLRLVSFKAALVVWDVLSAVAFATALRLVGLRDWRCFALALLSFPLASGLVLGQPSAFIALGYALAWRYRDRRYASGVVVAVLVAIKILAWPLLLWLLASRRTHAAAVGVLSTLGLLVASWTAIGFKGLREYPQLLEAISAGFGARTHSIVSAGATVGLGPSAGRAIALLVAIVLLAFVVRLARQRADSAAYAGATAAGIYLSPVVHPHYLLALIVALAVVATRAGWIWVAVLGFWISPTEPPAAAWRLDISVAIAMTLVIAALRTPRADALDAEGLDPVGRRRVAGFRLAPDPRTPKADFPGS